MVFERYLGFAIWTITYGFFVVWGIYCMFSKTEKSFGFWANAEAFPVNDVKKYNRALGRLWCVFGAVGILLGIPLLPGQNSSLLVLTLVGCMLEAIIAMAVYVTVIEKKYRKR